MKLWKGQNRTMRWTWLSRRSTPRLRLKLKLLGPRPECRFSATPGAIVWSPTFHSLIPEINPEHLGLIEKQKKSRELPGRGFIVTNANCSTTVLAMALAPLERAFGLQRLSVVTLQAVSGAGYPGLPSMEILGNVIPFIAGEEEKMEAETQKILGKLGNGAVEPASMKVSAQVNRVPVFDGHTESVSFETARPAGLEEIRDALASFRGEAQELELPTAPAHPIVVLDAPDRPQPMLDLYRENAMATIVGRLRPCSVLNFKMTLLGHNTIRERPEARY